MVPLGTVVTLTLRPGRMWFIAITVSLRSRFWEAHLREQQRRAVDAMEKLATTSLPAATRMNGLEPTYQQKLAQGNEGIIFGFAAVLVFLCLAALYESWSIPFAVLMRCRSASLAPF